MLLMEKEISSKFITIDDREVHYLSGGKGEVLLFLHGWPTSSYLWRDVLPGMATNHKVIALDLPGFGKSSKILSDSYSFRYYEKVITSFLVELNIEKVTLCVHDLGGPLGLFWACNNLEKVSRLVLFNTLVFPEFSWAVKLFGLASYLPGIKQWLVSPKGIEKAIYLGVNKKERLSSDIIKNYQEPFQTSEDKKTLLKTVQRLNPKGFHFIANTLPSFEGPIQVIFGEKDRILPEVGHTMERVKNILPQTQILSFDDCGHFLQEEASDRIVSQLLQFLEQNSLK